MKTVLIIIFILLGSFSTQEAHSQARNRPGIFFSIFTKVHRPVNKTVRKRKRGLRANKTKARHEWKKTQKTRGNYSKEKARHRGSKKNKWKTSKYAGFPIFRTKNSKGLHQ